MQDEQVELINSKPWAQFKQIVMSLASQTLHLDKHWIHLPSALSENPGLQDVQKRSTVHASQFLRQLVQTPILKTDPGLHSTQSFADPIQVMQEGLQGKQTAPDK